MKRVKKILLVVFMLLVAFAGYVEIVNFNSTNMSYRQKVMKAIYPALMWFTNLTGKNTKKLSNDKVQPPVSFYSLKATLNNDDVLDFSTLKGKKVLLVNTASACGYTEQYSDLQKLYEQNISNLVVIGFPANDFKEQEKGTDEEIAQFCKLNFGVSFPLVKKSVVIKSPEQNPVFQWLTDATKNGWNNEFPSWNFSKYLVNEEGVLTDYFGPSVSPTGSEITDKVNAK